MACGSSGRRHVRRQSLPEFQRLFPDDAACAEYLESRAGVKASSVRTVVYWRTVSHCDPTGRAGMPKMSTSDRTTVGTVMERSHTPLSIWFWAAYLVASQTPGISAVQFQRQLGLSRYETAFQHSPQTARRNGPAGPGSHQWPRERACRGGRNLGRRPDTRRRPRRSPQGSCRLRRRGAPSEAWDCAGQAKGWALCGARSAGGRR